MPLREYRPISAKGKVNESNTYLKLVWDSTNPQSHQCVKLGDYILVRNNSVNLNSIISVKTPDRKPKIDIIKKFPAEYQKEVRTLKEKSDLNQAQLKKLQREIKSIEKQNLTIEDKIKQLEKRAVQIKFDDNQKLFMNGFRKKYSMLNEYLCDDLINLDPEYKAEVKNLLTDLSNIMANYLNEL